MLRTVATSLIYRSICMLHQLFHDARVLYSHTAPLSSQVNDGPGYIGWAALDLAIVVSASIMGHLNVVCSLQ